MTAGLVAQRTKGTIDLRFSAVEDETQIVTAFQSGAGRVRFPRRADSEALQAILINTAGGLTGGDEFQQSVRLDRFADTVVTSQAFEKIYRTDGHHTLIQTCLDVGSNANLIWVPQPSILFDAAKLKRSTEIKFCSDASFVALESMIFGRSKMGECVRTGFVNDGWRLFRDGKLVFADTFRAGGDIESILNRKGTFNGLKACATAIAQCPEIGHVTERVAAFRADSDQMISGSCVNGIVVIKMLAESGRTLQQLIGACMRDVFSLSLPRIWQI